MGVINFSSTVGVGGVQVNKKKPSNISKVSQYYMLISDYNIVSDSLAKPEH